MLKVNDRVKIIGVNVNGANNYIGAEGNVNSIGHIYAYVNGIKMKSGTFGAWFPIKSLEKIETIEVGDEVEIIGKSHTNKINNIGRKATVDLDYEDGDFSVVFSNGIKGVFSSTSLKLLRKAENRVDYPKDDEQKKENSDSFYCCYVEGTGGFAYKHSTEDKAVKEAERLARKENRKVYVLKAIKSCEIPDSPVKWNNL